MHPKLMIYVLILVSISLCAFSVISLFYVDSQGLRDAVVLEGQKILLQFIVIAIGAGLFIKYVEHFSTKMRTHAEIRTTYLSRLGSAYREIKSIRRSLTSVGFSSRINPPTESLDLDEYKKEMSRLDAAQLQLEQLAIEAKRHPALSKIEGLKEKIRNMEKYVRKITKEFQTENHHLQPGFTLDDIPKLKEFTQESREDAPFEYFVDNYHSVVVLLFSYDS